MYSFLFIVIRANSSLKIGMLRFKGLFSPCYILLSPQFYICYVIFVCYHLLWKKLHCFLEVNRAMCFTSKYVSLQSRTHTETHTQDTKPMFFYQNNYFCSGTRRYPSSTSCTYLGITKTFMFSSCFCTKLDSSGVFISAYSMTLHLVSIVLSKYLI